MSEAREKTRAIQRLRNKISELNAQQSNAQNRASVQGMTTMESEQYRKRHYLIGRLMRKLAVLDGREGTTHMTKKRKKRLRGKVEKVLKQSPSEPEKVQIGVESADDLYREIRVENVLEGEDGERASLKPGAEVDVVIEADTDATIKKPE